MFKYVPNLLTVLDTLHQLFVFSREYSQEPILSLKPNELSILGEIEVLVVDLRPVSDASYLSCHTLLKVIGVEKWPP